MPVVDAHQHCWNLERVSYPWLTPSLRPIHRTIEPPELEPQLRELGVDATVLVQAMDSYEDTEHMFELAQSYPFIVGVVGWVPLDRPDEAAAALDRHRRNPYFCGIRHLIHEEADPDWVVRDSVIDGLRALADRDVPFDVVAVQPRHLEHVPILAERVPGLRMVVDHLAKPPIRDGGWQPWASLFARAAEYPNVYAKVSGLNTAADPQTWTASDLQRYVDYAVSCFGPKRLMYGGDWPISLLAGDYAKVWTETNKTLAALPEADRSAILGETAIRFYSLTV